MQNEKVSSVSTAVPVLVAHRGASYKAPENTLPSFRLAWQEQADKIEGDFWLTADDRIVCIHDSTTERTALNQRVADMREARYADLQKYDVGHWKSSEYQGTKIPILEDVLSTVPTGAGIYIEIKQDTPKIINVLLDTIAASPVNLSQVTLISFNPEIVRQGRALTHELRISLLYDPDGNVPKGAAIISPAELVSLAVEVGASGLGLNKSQKIDEDFVQQIRDAGLEFHVWTVNTVEDARRFIELGVDSITTDRPAALRKELDLV